MLIINEGTSFQAYHLLQRKWAKENLKDYGYKYDLTPTISLGIGYYMDNEKQVVAPHTIVTSRLSIEPGNACYGGEEDVKKVISDFPIQCLNYILNF